MHLRGATSNACFAYIESLRRVLYAAWEAINQFAVEVELLPSGA